MSLIELMASTFIVVVLTAVLCPAIQSSRELARRTQCSSRFRQLGIAMHSYHSTYKTFPPAGIVGRDFNVSAWGQQVLPYIDCAPLYNRINASVPAVREASQFGFNQQIADVNISALSTTVPTFVCASAPVRQEALIGTLPAGYGGLPVQISWVAAAADIVAPCGLWREITFVAQLSASDQRWDRIPLDGGMLPAGVVDNRGSSRIQDIADGASNTILLSERIGGPHVYAGKYLRTSHNPHDPGLTWGFVLDQIVSLGGSEQDGRDDGLGGPCIMNCSSARGAGLYGLHPCGCLALMADGSVRFISESTDNASIASLLVRADGIFELVTH